jgi:hypothetical protein
LRNEVTKSRQSGNNSKKKAIEAIKAVKALEIPVVMPHACMDL